MCIMHNPPDYKAGQRTVPQQTDFRSCSHYPDYFNLGLAFNLHCQFTIAFFIDNSESDPAPTEVNGNFTININDSKIGSLRTNSIVT